MIKHLSIKNVTIIEELEISFFKGLNILSGETGAGKSIIIDSIGFILGNKVNKDFIRMGQNNALVQCLVHITNDDTMQTLKNKGIDINEDRHVLISRNINLNGKTNLRINQKTTTITTLKEIAPLLIDIHGQHQHQSLLNSDKHIYLLDRFCDNEIDKVKKQLLDDIKAYKEATKTINAISNEDVESKIKTLKYNINEIEIANLKQNEEETLQKRKKLLNEHKSVVVDISKSLELLYGNHTEEGAIDKIRNTLKLVSNISNIDASKTHLLESLETISIQLDDIISQLRNNDEDYDPNELENIEERLNYIYSLKRKYGKTMDEILLYNNELTTELNKTIENFKLINNLKEDKKNLQNKIIESCNKISLLRSKTAQSLEIEIENNLKDLGMKNAQFKISINKKSTFNNNGNDKVEFLISSNIGEPLKSLSKIASGGEMSRVMLALKVVLSKTDVMDTFIFDEIDTGVSGRTAQKVAEKLAIISKNKQILCITHLPQISSMGDNHFLIEKKAVNNKTTTSVSLLNKDEINAEIARLIGGAKITDATIVAAKEMKEMAQKLKSNL